MCRPSVHPLTNQTDAAAADDSTAQEVANATSYPQHEQQIVDNRNHQTHKAATDEAPLPMNLQQCRDSLSQFLTQEASLYPQQHQILLVADSSQQLRTEMAHWLVTDLRERYHLSLDCMERALYYLDRYFSASTTTSTSSNETSSKAFYQLITLTCIYLAQKVLETKKHVWSSNQITYLLFNDVDDVVTATTNTNNDLSPGQQLQQQLYDQTYFTASNLERYEMEVLKATQWKLHPPTSFTFAHYLVECLQLHQHQLQHDAILALVERQLELSIMFSCNSSTTPTRPSQLANAALSNALHIIAQLQESADDDWMPTNASLKDALVSSRNCPIANQLWELLTVHEKTTMDRLIQCVDAQQDNDTDDDFVFYDSELESSHREDDYDDDELFIACMHYQRDAQSPRSVVVAETNNKH